MFNGYLSFAGVEIVNIARTMAYADFLNIPGTTGDGCDECPDLTTALGGVTYSNPALDPAPWFDVNVTESAELAGFLIMEYEGTGSTNVRETTPLARGGGVVGPYRRAPRELRMVIQAVASTLAGAQYGVAWLSKQLRGSECSPLSSEFAKLDTTLGCGSDVLCMLAVCPSTPITLQTSRVNLYDVGVTSGPTVVQQQTTDNGTHGCVGAWIDLEVTFTAGDPGWYYAPTRIADVTLSDYWVGTAPYDIEQTYVDLGCGTEACFDEAPVGCADTAGPVIAAPPTPCAGTPSFTANHYAVPLDFSAVPTSMDMVPMLYYTGSEATPATTLYEGPVAFQVRRTTPDAPCGSVANPCDVPIEIFTAQQRRQRTGLLDWRARQAYRTQSTIPVCPYPTFTRELAPFTWPTLVCTGPMCLDVYINEANDGRGQRIAFDVMRRVDGLA